MGGRYLSIECTVFCIMLKRGSLYGNLFQLGVDDP